MGYDLDCAAYRLRMRGMSHAELRKREIIKYRQGLTASWAVGHGVGLAFFTCGVSLIGSALAGRRIYVANNKLEIVKAELKSRKIPLYKPRKRDFTIPIVVCLASFGLGVGTTIASFDATSLSTAENFANPTEDVVQEAAAQPTEFVHDVGQGVTTQVEQVIAAATGDMTHEAVAATNSAIIEETAAGIDPAGLALGLHLAQVAEVQFIQNACMPLAYCFRGSKENADKKSQTCTLTPVEDCKHNRIRSCFGCKALIPRQEAHYHCCACSSKGYLFNVCETCVLTLQWECREPKKHILYRIIAEEEDSVSANAKDKVQMEVREIAVTPGTKELAVF